MTYDIRALIESDLQYTLEGDYGKPVVLIAPDGERVEVRGQVLFDTAEFDPETGAMLIYEKPVVTLRRTALSRIPGEKEKWAVIIPASPAATEATEIYSLERPVEGGRSIGFLRLYLTKVKESP